MPKVAKVLCVHCEKKMDAGASFCPHCEQPTHWATHDERVAWELSNYQKMRSLPLEPARPGSTPIRRVSTPRVSLEVPARQAAHASTIVRTEPRPAAHEPPLVKKKPPITPVAPAAQAAPQPAAPAPKAAPRRAPASKAPAKEQPATPKTSRTSAAEKPAASGARSRKTLREAMAETPATPPAPATPTPKDVIDMTARIDRSKEDAAPRPAAVALMEEQVQLLRDVVARLTAIEESVATMTAEGAHPAPAAAGQTSLLRRLRRRPR